MNKLRLLEINMGHTELLKLRKEDMKYFSTVLFVLDGDVSSDEIKYENIIKLPGKGENPEKVFLNYLQDLTDNPHHEIWSNPAAYQNNFTIATF